MLSPSTLRSVLSNLKPIFSGKRNLPVLDTVLVKRSARSISLRATSLDTFVTYEEVTDQPQPGTLRYFLDSARLKKEPPTEACLEFAMLHEIAKLADPRSTITLTPEKDSHQITCRSTVGSDIQRESGGLPAADFPEPPKTEIHCRGTFPQLAGRIDRCRPFISVDQTRYVLNGIFLDPQGHIVATDGRRLVLCASSSHWSPWSHLEPGQHGCEPDMPYSIILPTEACNLIAKIFPHDAPLTVEIMEQGRWAKIHHGNWTLHSRLIDGNYPNWRAVMPNLERDVHHTLPLTSVGRATLIKAMATMASKTCVRFRLECEGYPEPLWGMVQLDGETGKGSVLQSLGINQIISQENLTAAKAFGILTNDPGFECMAHTGFVRDCLSSAFGAVSIHFTGTADNPGPIAFTATPDYTAVLMPIRHT